MNDRIRMNERVKSFISSNIIEIIVVFFLMMITYGYEITHYALTLDEEIYVYHERSQVLMVNAGSGRFMTGLLQQILPSYKVLPFFSIFCSVCVLAIGAIWICKMAEWFQSGLWGRLLAMSAYCCMPLFSFYLMFDFSSLECSIGVVLTIYSGYKMITALCETKSKRDFIIAILCLAAAIAIYQILLSIYICIVCFGLLGNIYRNEEEELCEFLKRTGLCIFGLVAALAIYYGANFFFQRISNDVGYVDSFIKWNQGDNATVVKEVIYRIKLLIRYPNSVFEGGYVLFLAYAALFICFLYMIVKNKSLSMRVCTIISFMGIFLSIFIGNIFFGGEMPRRTMMVLHVFTGLSLAALFGILQKYTKLQKLSMMLCIALMVVFLNQSARVEELFYSENKRQTRDIILATKIADDIEDLGYGICPPYKIAFVGFPETLDANLEQEEFFSQSMLHTGDMPRTIYWFRWLGYDYNGIEGDVEWNKAIEHGTDMPIWPEEGSIELWEDMIVVNLGRIEAE